MYSIDFEYNGLKLSDVNGMICCIDGSTDGAISFGADLTWNTVKSGNNFILASYSYDTAYECTFQFIKYNCSNMNDYYFTEQEITFIERWLRQKTYRKFKPIYDDYSFSDVYYNAAFTIVNPIVKSGKVIGFELTLTTNAPFGYYEELNFVGTNSVSFHDISDEYGEISPDVTVKCLSSGNLFLECTANSTPTIVTNVSTNEVITFNSATKQISTSDPLHVKIYNHFNYVFPKIIKKAMEFNQVEDINTFNVADGSVNAEISITYSPIARVGII